MRPLGQILTLNRRFYSNHYEALGVSTKATLRDIKSAYYRLSMIYHPDRNKGCKLAAEKFCKLKEAYEVLADPATRKGYDLSLGLSRRVKSSPVPGTYNMNQYRGPNVTYDFKEWARAHYSESFTRRAEAKEQYRRREESARNARQVGKKENVVLTVAILFMIFFMLSFVGRDDLDDVHRLKGRGLEVKSYRKD
ncbi:hypothetical protein AAG570_012972 [Ranatra chinensis]|uniref:J domain-containing protein n=1 Tax=Ranatra chinensis TaxID=642074 RepID=A0ABD0YFZ1_9HEMI